MEAKEDVIVLMSTYNGGKFIGQQIESIIGQKGVNVLLLIRDDGSKDNTVEVIKECQRKYPQIILSVGDNIGVKKSFQELMCSAPKGRFYSLADQDDIWYSDKLQYGVKELKQHEGTPCLYFCNQDCIDENGKFLYRRFDDECIQPSVMHSVFRNEYSGCTFIFNNELLEEIQHGYKSIKQLTNIMHDSWLMILAQLIGVAVYDSKPHMAFRRHGNNVTESKLYNKMTENEKVEAIKRSFRTMNEQRNNRGYTTEICSGLMREYQDRIKPDTMKLLKVFCGYKKSVWAWLSMVINNPLSKYYSAPKYKAFLKLLFLYY